MKGYGPYTSNYSSSGNLDEYYASAVKSLKQNITVGKLAESIDNVADTKDSKLIAKRIFSGEIKQYQELLNAIFRRGEVKEFLIDLPWHPKLFLEQKIVTYPFQHTSVVAYHGTSRLPFYNLSTTRKYIEQNPDLQDSSEPRDPESVIRKGFFEARNSERENYSRYLRESDDINSASDAFFSGFLNSAEDFAKRPGEVIIEVEIPSTDLIILVTPKEKRDGNGGFKHSKARDSFKSLHKDFGSPQAFWNICARAARRQSKDDFHSQSIQFLYNEGVAVDLGLDVSEPPARFSGRNQVASICELVFSKGSYNFVKPRKYVRRLEKNIPQRLPTKEYNNVFILNREGLKLLKENSRSTQNLIFKIKSYQSTNPDKEQVKKLKIKYEKYRGNLEKLAKGNTNYQIKKDVSPVNDFNSLDWNFKRKTQGIVDSYDKTNRLIMKEGLNKEIEAEIMMFNEKVEEILLEVLKLPHLS